MATAQRHSEPAPTQNLARALLKSAPDGITDIIPGIDNVYVEFDERRVSAPTVERWIDGTTYGEDWPTRPIIDIPVRYGGEDLPAIAITVGLDVSEIVRRHAGQIYRVNALGFTPGFPYLGDVDPSIRVPRRPTPRRRVDALTVAMADRQTGIYPVASPSGWQILGRTPQRIYDPTADEPFLLQPGDRVRFYPLEDARDSSESIEPSLDLLPETPAHPLLKVLEPGLLDLPVDEGRWRVGRFGLARGGPLDSVSARLANTLLHNPASSVSIEINRYGGRYLAMAESVYAFAGWGMIPRINGTAAEPFTSFPLRPGDELTFQPQGRGCRGYLAAAGGIESGTFLGSASTDLRGHVGRALRAGDILGRGRPTRAKPGFSFRPHHLSTPIRVLRLYPGPQATPDALAMLQSSSYTVARADRMGIILDGPPVPGGGIRSEAVPLGAIQVTSGGTPILLMHDRGTVGGYTKPAIVHPEDLPLAGQLQEGDRVRLRLA